MSWGNCEDCLYYNLGICEDGEIGSEASCFESCYDDEEDESLEELDDYDDRLECGCCSCCGCSCEDE